MVHNLGMLAYLNSRCFHLSVQRYTENAATPKKIRYTANLGMAESLKVSRGEQYP
ncbi:hypothetical protein DYBT9623_04402 [Dyadobacter sp. CECT 9623]|uniref:Uncharacterized protein n=1 Tax=Dyadobacter linearis TaxID=2823330 RepID=A0ABM8UVW9_9BACT|nr:hypothetical protein DYBT9623_04402 [Dyadobacter sp. CECT 9623]